MSSRARRGGACGSQEEGLALAAACGHHATAEMVALHGVTLAVAASAILSPAHAFYLPGVAPHEYKDGDPVRRTAGLLRVDAALKLFE